LCIVYCVLCIVYCVLCIVYCVLCIVGRERARERKREKRKRNQFPRCLSVQHPFSVLFCNELGVEAARVMSITACYITGRLSQIRVISKLVNLNLYGLARTVVTCVNLF
jgi:hypothetical protein